MKKQLVLSAALIANFGSLLAMGTEFETDLRDEGPQAQQVFRSNPFKKIHETIDAVVEKGKHGLQEVKDTYFPETPKIKINWTSEQIELLTKPDEQSAQSVEKVTERAENHEEGAQQAFMVPVQNSLLHMFDEQSGRYALAAVGILLVGGVFYILYKNGQLKKVSVWLKENPRKALLVATIAVAGVAAGVFLKDKGYAHALVRI